MGIICPEGQEVGDRKSGDQMGSGPNALQPKKSRYNDFCILQEFLFKKAYDSGILPISF